jgi:TP53 regulating kinase-like protein
LAAIPFTSILYIDRPSFDDIDASDSAWHNVLRQVNVLVTRLQDNEIIHSGVTTSNLMLQDGGVRVIDFGLSFISAMAKDTIIDQYALERRC